MLRAICVTIALGLFCAARSAGGTLYVDDDAPLGGDGQSWTTAYRYLQDALLTAAAGDEIRVAGGRYTPDRGEGGQVTPGDRSVSFVLPSGVALYGGYAGLADPASPDTRDIDAYETVLTGDLAGDDQPDFVNYEENTRQVVYIGDANADTRLDGMTVTSGNNENDVGAGVVCWGNNVATVAACRVVNNTAESSTAIYTADPTGGLAVTFEGCYIAGNRATRTSFFSYIVTLKGQSVLEQCIVADNINGAAVACTGGTPVVRQCTISENTGFAMLIPGWSTHVLIDQCSILQNAGILSASIPSVVIRDSLIAENTGPLMVVGSSESVQLALENCVIRDNADPVGSGTVRVSHAVVAAANCLFQGNHPNTALRIGTNAVIELEYCGFIENIGDIGGAAVVSGNGSLSARRCWFKGNNATVSGGAIYSDDDASVQLTECWFEVNFASDNYAHGGGAVRSEGPLTVSRCAFLGNSTVHDGSGGAILSGADLTVSDSLFVGNHASRAGGAILASTSGDVSIAGSTFVGNTAGWQGGALYRLNHPASAPVTTSILWDNNAPTGPQHAGSLSLHYCDVMGGGTGGTNINVDPLFADPDGPDNDPDTWEDNDYRLSAASPCIDAGEPAYDPGFGASDLDGFKRIWDGDDDGTPIVDMGAYEFGSYRYGDMNCDGLINAGDIDPFICALVDTCDYPATYPDGDELLADLDANGLINAGDIDPFIAVLAGD